MVSVTISPAYGRDYPSKAKAIADFEADKDFIVQSLMDHGGTYCNRTDLIDAGYPSVVIRYKKLTQCCVVKLPKSKVAK